jgi:hypothetical protein
VRLLLAAFGRVLVDLAVLESEHDNSDDEADDADGPIIGLGAQVTHADHYPLGFTFEAAPDRWPFGDE